MAALSLFLTREKAVRYFKEQEFTFTGNAVSLVLSKDGKTLGWYYSYMGVYALSTKANSHQMLDQPLSGYRTLVGGQVFLHQGHLYRYCAIKISTHGRPSSSLIIRGYTEVLNASEVEELKITEKPYNLCGVIDKETNQLLTFVWAAGNIEHPEHFYPVFEQDFSLNLKKRSLRKFKVGEEFKFQNRYWMVNTHQGSPCLCELDIQLRRKMERIHNVSYSRTIPEY